MRTQNQLMQEWIASLGGKSTFARDMFLNSLNEHEQIIFQLALGAETEAGFKALEIASKKFNELSDSMRVALMPYLDISIQKANEVSETQPDTERH